MRLEALPVELWDTICQYIYHDKGLMLRIRSLCDWHPFIGHLLYDFVPRFTCYTDAER